MNVIIVLGGLVLKIDNDDLEIGRTLGEGGFGEVRKGVWKPRKVDVAVKTVLTKSKFEDEVSLDQSLPTFDQSLPTFDESLPVNIGQSLPTFGQCIFQRNEHSKMIGTFWLIHMLLPVFEILWDFVSALARHRRSINSTICVDQFWNLVWSLDFADAR